MLARGRGSHNFSAIHTQTIPAFTAAEHHRRLAGTHYLPTEGWPGWVELGGWLCTEIGFWHRELNWTSDTVTHISTDRAGRRVTLLIETNVLALSHTATLLSIMVDAVTKKEVKMFNMLSCTSVRHLPNRCMSYIQQYKLVCLVVWTGH